MHSGSSRLMPFEIFVLFCLKLDMATPYRISSAMGVGVGATSPALKRLTYRKLAHPVADSRNRTSYAITAKGERELRLALQAGPKTYGNPKMRGIFEALPRTIYFAWVKGDLREADEALDIAEADLLKKKVLAQAELDASRRILDRPRAELQNLDSQATPEYLATVYKLIKATADTAELSLQLQALRSLQDMIGQLPPSAYTFLNDPLPAEEAGNDEMTNHDGKSDVQT